MKRIARRDAPDDLFRDAVRDVAPIASANRVEPFRILPPPIPAKRREDEQAVLVELARLAFDDEYARAASPGIFVRRVASSPAKPSAMYACAVSPPMSMGSTAMLRTAPAPPAIPMLPRFDAENHPAAASTAITATTANHRRDDVGEDVATCVAAGNAVVGIVPLLWY